MHELSWQRLASPNEIASVGDIVTFKVIHLEDPDGTPRRLGSIKRLFPEHNPWRDPNAYSVGIKFRGKVDLIVSYGAFVRHPAGACGLLHLTSYSTENIRIAKGDVFDFVVIACDTKAEQFSVELS